MKQSQIFLIIGFLIVIIILLGALLLLRGNSRTVTDLPAAITIQTTSTTQTSAPTTTTFTSPGTQPSLSTYVPTTTLPGADEVTWSEAQLLTRQCKVIQLVPGSGGGSYILFDVKASVAQGKNPTEMIFDYRPTLAELTALAQSVSSTCGLVRVQNPMY